MNITLRQLQALMAVIEAGSFTRAAERLGVAQPGLSGSISALEKALATRLLQRTTRRVEPTEAGRVFAAAARSLLGGLDQAVADVKDLAEARRGRIVVAAPPFLASGVLPSAVAAFRERHPDVTVVLIDTSTASIVERVLSGEVEFGVGTFEPEGALRRRVLAREALALFQRREAQPAGEGPLDWAALSGLPLVTLTRDSGIRRLVEFGFQSAGADLLLAYEVGHINSALGLVDSGCGVAVLPASAAPGVDSARVVVRPLRAPVVSRAIELVTAPGRVLSPAAERFAAVIAAQTRRLAAGETSA